MKKKLPYILISVLVFSTIFLVPHITHAQIISSITGGAAKWLLALPGTIATKYLLPLVGYLTAFAGLILNYVIYQTVLHMSDLFPNASIINDTWNVIRDVANMCFIFLLLYSAIQTIFGQGKTRELIVNIIIAALLVNFSLFFTKVIVDSSNILAISIYNSIAPGAISTPDVTNAGLSNSVMAPLQLQTIYKYTQPLDGVKLLTIGVLGSIFALVAAFVFFVAAIMFVVRFVVILFLMILSPVWILGGVIPGLKGIQKQWLESLVGQAVFAPIFFLLVWIVLKIGNALYKPGSIADALLNTAAAGANNTSQINTSGSTMGVIFSFVIMIGMLIAALIISKSFSTRGAKQIGQLTGFAAGAVMGGAASLGRKSFGAAGSKFADSEALKNRAQQGGLSGFAARRALDLSSAASKTSFDLRGAGGPAKGLVGIAGGGKAGGQGGYAKQVADETKRKEEKVKLYTQTSDITKDKAKRDLEAAKKMELQDPETLTAWKAEQNKRSQEAREAERELANAQARGADPDTITALRKKSNDANNERQKIQTIRGFKDARIEMAQKRADKLEGINKKESDSRKADLNKEEEAKLKNDPAIKRQVDLKKEMEDLTKQIATQTGTIKDDMQRELDAKSKLFETVAKEAEERSKTIKAEFQERRDLIREEKSLGEERKEAAIKSMLNPSIIDSDRILFVGPVKRSNLQAAANLRKGKKSIRERVEELMKDNEDIPKKDEERKEGGEKPEGEGEKK
ncbi:hypothetical protein KW790_01350 [Candidatus Parcubacteria bacterium]|nr:hypothetical protein [Candidatus Parcubacteria bacterium]